MDDIKRICLWSGPRNISTALMYSFAQRKDTKVYDEPLYAYYLKNHSEAHKYHPGAEDILEVMENNGDKIVEMMLTENEKPVLFFKHMIHHLLGLDKEFMRKTVNIILTRDPFEMLPSFDRVIPNPVLDDVGYKLHMELLEYFQSNNISFTVIDSKQVLINPEKTLNNLCEFAEIEFDRNMLSWKPQKRKEDGIWSKYWYDSVHNSSGFMKYMPKEAPFPNHLQPLLTECRPYYVELLKHTL
ncbi:sulfotransferase family protein [Winogradskyella sp. A2]|uniref:sulfotransferase-like domain-containing protein n=1 Tax=Winogradskyella sp. A2 TaxID=3366944 RepID=UPI00398C2D0A